MPGECVRAIKESRPAAEIVAEMMAEARLILEHEMSYSAQ
jgi:hypothetical protein